MRGAGELSARHEQAGVGGAGGVETPGRHAQHVVATSGAVRLRARDLVEQQPAGLEPWQRPAQHLDMHRVRERDELAAPVGVHADDAGGLERLEHVEPGVGRQLVHAERGAEGEQLDQVALVVVEVSDPLRDKPGEAAADVERAVEHPDAVHRGQPLRDDRARDQLAQVERVALGDVPERVLGTGGDRAAQHVVQERGHRGARQVGQVDAQDSAASLLGQEHARGGGAGALGGDQHHETVAPEPRQEVDRHDVELVDVVHVHHHAGAVAELADVVDDAVEDGAGLERGRRTGRQER